MFLFHIRMLERLPDMFFEVPCGSHRLHDLACLRLKC
jgi:hypothetical protein